MTTNPPFLTKAVVIANSSPACLAIKLYFPIGAFLRNNHRKKQVTGCDTLVFVTQTELQTLMKPLIKSTRTTR